MAKFQTENSDLIEKALNYAKSHMGNTDITVEEVAENAGFSTNYFNHIFMSHTGFPVMGYIRFERLREAAKLLRLTDKSILNIALQVGFESQEGFTRSFKGQYEVTPGEYRKNKKQLALSWNELVDPTLAQRFLHNYTDFHSLDVDETIDELLSIDAKRFGYLCVTIKEMGLHVVSEFDTIEKGIVLIGDKRNGEYYLTLVCDDEVTLKRWCSLFPNIMEIHTRAKLPDIQNVEKRMEFMFFGECKEISLPENIDIHQLSPKDMLQIRQWAEGRKDGYTAHLLQMEKYWEDPAILEYGVFSDVNMIAAVGCGISHVHGFAINDGIQIFFKKGYEQKQLYKIVYEWVTNNIVKKEIIPFDNIQYGNYALSHGGFTAEEIGYTLVEVVYTLY